MNNDRKEIMNTLDFWSLKVIINKMKIQVLENNITTIIKNRKQQITYVHIKMENKIDIFMKVTICHFIRIRIIMINIASLFATVAVA